MKSIPDDLYKKMVKLSDEVKRQLLKKGIVIPAKNADGSVNIGYFKIIKNDEGFYAIINSQREVIVDGINLPQTAVIVANGLALGKFKDSEVINHDKRYGYALFEETRHKQALENSNKKSLEYFDLAMTKYSIARAKKEYHKKDVVRSFQKLIKLV
jgi:hypothetical protein